MKPLVAHLVRIPKDENRPLQHWAIDGLPRLNGKPQRKFFRTKEAAERALASVKVKLRKEGENALLITDTLRIEAFDCFKLLKPYGASLKDAVRFYIVHHEAASKSCTVEAAVDEYLRIQRLKRRSDRHLADLKYRLGAFKERVGTMLISSLSVHDSGLADAKAGFRSLTEAIDTTTPAGRMMMQMVGAFAEFRKSNAQGTNQGRFGCRPRRWTDRRTPSKVVASAAG